ncbi:MAG: tRNA epoxyqueuosine(34) reductase QueG, partial [Deltaproteobacteria bacterium]|nr:tRNA epoxyqueuosine(34) reductase QueG [Deltaproteobacteria bacterium]
RDYHGFLGRRLRRLAAFVRSLAPGVAARALCDSSPVLERAWAARAGLGFIGKHGLLVVPGQGSYVLLGEVVTTLALPANRPLRRRCGRCRCCLDACPTGALVAPYELEACRCLAYATIESRSPPPAALWPAWGERLFGCDACQEACPLNAVAPPPAEQTEPFRPLARWGKLDLGTLALAREPHWHSLTQASPLRRATRAGLARSALLVAAGRWRRGDAGARTAIEAAREHDDATVRRLAGTLLGARAGP